VVAFFSANDPHHQSCLDQFASLSAELVTTWPVLTEAAWLLRRYPRQVREMLSWTQRKGLHVEPITAADVVGITAILETHEDQSFDLADATLFQLSNRLGIGTVLTLDRRHFTVYRGPAGKSLELLPQ
jgi:predicted nucleic acid-binding protein